MNLLIAATCRQLRPSLLTWLQPRSAQESALDVHSSTPLLASMIFEQKMNKNWIKPCFNKFPSLIYTVFITSGIFWQKKSFNSGIQKKWAKLRCPRLLRASLALDFSNTASSTFAGLDSIFSCLPGKNGTKGKGQSGWIHMGFWGLALQFIQTYSAPGMFCILTPRVTLKKTTWSFI